MISVAGDVVCWFLCAALIRMATGKREVRLQPAAQFALTAVLFNYITHAGYRVFMSTYMLFFAGHLLVDVSSNYVRHIISWLRNEDKCSIANEENEENEENGENEENEENEKDSTDEEPQDYVVRRRRRSPSPRIVRRKSRRLEKRFF